MAMCKRERLRGPVSEGVSPALQTMAVMSFEPIPLNAELRFKLDELVPESLVL